MRKETKMHASLERRRALRLCLVILCSSLPLRGGQLGLFTYTLIGDSAVKITAYPADATGPVVIPASIDGKPVTMIGQWAFFNCIGMTSVSIPSSITHIEEDAFMYCTGLTSIVIPDGVVSLGDEVFAGCTGLTSATVPATVTDMDGDTFSGCTGLTSVTLQPGLTFIGRSMFENCKSLAGIAIPSSVTSIGSLAFSGCESLTAVAMPDDVTTIGVEAFCSCKSLTSVAIPAGVTAISRCTFLGCSGMKRVSIPSAVTSIADEAFAGCSSLIGAAFSGDAPGMGFAVFTDFAPGFTIYHFSGGTGFTSPEWAGYPSAVIDEASFPLASWLLTHGVWFDTDLRQDLDGDGVSLLMAYALDLDPRHNLRGSLPVPVPGPTLLSLNFQARRSGITYRVETSTDLRSWFPIGVVQPAPGEDLHVTASIPIFGPARFLRLAVQK